MLNKKRMVFGILLSLFVILSIGCGKKKEEIIDSELISEDNISVGYADVTVGDFVSSAVVSAEKVYGLTADLTFPFNQVEMEATYVKTGDKVKQGDLIAKIKIPTQENINEYAQSIQDERDLCATVLDSFTTRINEKNSLAASASGAEREVYQAEANVLVKEKEQYTYTMNKSIKEMEAELEQLKHISGQENMYAPFDGIVKSIAEVDEGDTVTSDYVVATIYSADNILFSFDNKEGFRYGSEVTVEAGIGENRQTIKGVVVAADNVMFEDFHTGRAYVKATEEFDTAHLQNITIKGEIVRVNNVLTVDRLAVTENKEKFGLSIKFDEGTKFRHITLGAIGDNKAWILQGAEDGQCAAIE